MAAANLIAQGLYLRVRHLRYLGMMTGVFGACLIVATPALRAASIVWLALAPITIGAEERQPHARLGPAYRVYSEQVPAPLRLISRPTQTAPRRDQP
jgi:protein-S-isoprenylcysteine O-methyltransferase Ste14